MTKNQNAPAGDDDAGRVPSATLAAVAFSVDAGIGP